MAPPPPPGSPPPQLPQPKLKNPEQHNQFLYFRYDLNVNKMIISPSQPMMPIMINVPPPIQQMNVQQMTPIQPYPYNSNSNNGRYHNDAKITKSSRSSSSKHYHSSSNKPMYATNETNLIVISSTPSNA